MTNRITALREEQRRLRESLPEVLIEDRAPIFARLRDIHAELVNLGAIRSEDTGADIFGRVWPEGWDVCPTCGQPDSCGDCNHRRLSDDECRQLLTETTGKAALYWYLSKAVATADTDALTDGMNHTLDVIEREVPGAVLLAAKPADWDVS